MRWILLLCPLPGLCSEVAVLEKSRLYGVTVWAPGATPSETVVEIRDPLGVVVSKKLHALDPDLYVTIRARADGRGVVFGASGLRSEWVELPVSGQGGIISEQAAEWASAQPIRFGQTVFGSADERPYFVASSESKYDALRTGFHWFRVSLEGAKPQLAFFVLETPDRDVAGDVEVFTRSGDGIEAYNHGTHSYVPEATQNLPGLSGYRTRILQPGATYYIRVAANHPAYQLRVYGFDPPPYRDPRQAVRVGMDFLANLGDSWLGNIPRRGSTPSRDLVPHVEAQGCVACHPTQFTSRAYLTARHNGYADTNPAQISNLVWQLRNNPRPFYGPENAAWSRVIFSAATVSSRLPILMDMAASAGVGPKPPMEAVRGLSEYLRLYYGDATRLPASEPDGASPVVSPFEIGLQSWKTFRMLGDEAMCDRLRRMLAAAPPGNVIDLNWKIVALAEIDRMAFAKDLNVLVNRLRQEQLANGHFAYEFGRKGVGADFITYHALYALAKAGKKPNEPMVARLVQYALKSQLPSGGWQGDPAYKAFNTPFRETQFAVMALSELYPARRPEASRDEPGSAVDDQLIWLTGAPAGEEVKVRSLLETSHSVLVRERAAAALGRFGSPESIPALIAALGDPSKLVQRSAALSLRRLHSSFPVDRALSEALASSSARQRWGALQVLSQQFRELTSSADLLSRLLVLADDPAPAIRLQAANALARWYVWQRTDAEQRSWILPALFRRVGEEPDARVRGVVMQSAYQALDENLGYLEAWQRPISETRRKESIAARREVVRHEAVLLAEAIQRAPRGQKISLLLAMWDLPMRHMAIPDNNAGKTDVILPSYLEALAGGVSRLHEKDYNYAPYREATSFRYSVDNRFQRTRVGNDSDLLDFSGASEELEDVLIDLAKGADQELAIAAIKAASTLGDSLSPEFTGAALRLLTNGKPEVKAAVRFVFEKHARGRLSLGNLDSPSNELIPALTAALATRSDDTLAVTLPLLADVPAGAGITRNQALGAQIERLLRDPPAARLGQVLEAAGAFRHIADAPLMRAVMLEALTSSDRNIYQPAVRVVVKNYLADISMPELATQFIAATKGPVRRYLLDSLDPERFSLRLNAVSSYNPGRVVIPADTNLFSSNIVQFLVADSVQSGDLQVRAAALDIVRENPALRQVAEVRAAMPQVAAQSAPKPDFHYFIKNVQPILMKAGNDGRACVMCHATHQIFPLRLPAGTSGFRPEQLKANYRFALNVVDVNQPKRSLLLIKPTRPNDAVGDNSLYLATHNGGERWAGNESSVEYETILSWIRGAK